MVSWVSGACFGQPQQSEFDLFVAGIAVPQIGPENRHDVIRESHGGSEEPVVPEAVMKGHRRFEQVTRSSTSRASRQGSSSAERDVSAWKNVSR